MVGSKYKGALKYWASFLNKIKMILMSKQTQATEKSEDLVTIYGTGNSRHMEHGKEFQVPQAEADHLVEAGHASLTKGGPKKEKAVKAASKEKNHTAGPNDHKK
jgi:hypothetical protein